MLNEVPAWPPDAKPAETMTGERCVSTFDTGVPAGGLLVFLCWFKAKRTRDEVNVIGSADRVQQFLFYHMKKSRVCPKI